MGEHPSRSLRMVHELLLGVPLVLVSVLAFACGPAVIGVGVGASTGGGSDAPPALALTASEMPPGAAAGPCGLVAVLNITVNRPNVRLTYSLNGASHVPFTDPRSGATEPEIPPDAPTQRSVLLRPVSNTLVIRASVGAEQVVQTLTIDRSSVDAVVIDLEPPSVNGLDMELNWSMDIGNETFFWIYFDDEARDDIDELAGTSGNGSSPLMVEVGQLDWDIVNGKRRYRLPVTDLAAAANGLLQHHYFAVRSNDGCESRIVAAHTRPREQEGNWPTSLVHELVNMARMQVAAPPVGGRASAEDKVGMPVLLVDRGADNTTVGVRPPDGIEEIVLVDRDGVVHVSKNNGRLTTGVGTVDFDAPVDVDDLENINPQPPRPCPSLPAGSTGEPIRSISLDHDGDRTPDLFVLTPGRIWVFDGDDAREPSSSRPTPGDLRLLNFKKRCSSMIDVALAGSPPSPLQFLDFSVGDFDGDGVLDLAASVGVPQSSASAGSTEGFYVWYANRASNGFTLADWPARPPDRIAVATAFGDDGYFVIGDVNADGRDDLVATLHESASASTGRYVVHLMRGRGAAPIEIRSGIVNPIEETARWDHTALEDLDHDGVLDIVGLRTVDLGPGLGPVVNVAGYRTVLTGPFSGSIDTAVPFLSPRRVGEARASGRNRGHLQLLDVEGDGLTDVVYRSVFTRSSSIPFEESSVILLRGRRDPQTGLQDWRSFDTTARRVNLPLVARMPTGPLPTPHVHAASADLNYDGILDFCAVHEHDSPPHCALVAESVPAWTYERFESPADSGDYPFGGTLLTGVDASQVAPTVVERFGDLLLQVEEERVVYLPSRADRGLRNGAFAPADHLPLRPRLPSGLLQARVPSHQSDSGDILVLLDNGIVGTLELDASGQEYRFNQEASVALSGPGAIHPARFDRDRRPDCLVWDGARTLSLLSTVDGSAGGRNLDLRVQDILSLPVTPEQILVANSEDDELSEVIVVLPQTGGERLIEVWEILPENGTGLPRFRARTTGIVPHPITTTVDGAVVSIANGNLVGRHEIDTHTRNWLVVGTDDGRVLFLVRNDVGGLNSSTQRPGVSATSGSRVQVHLADLTYDNILDLLVYEEGSSELELFRNRPDSSQPWRFPNPNAWQFQGSGEFDPPVTIRLPEPASAIETALVNDDPYVDLLVLSADGERVHLIVTKGKQVPP